jgi:hypothetical protein
MRGGAAAVKPAAGVDGSGFPRCSLPSGALEGLLELPEAWGIAYQPGLRR